MKMKHLLLILSITVILFTAFISCSETVCEYAGSCREIDYRDLIYRDGLYYEKFTDTPFTGKYYGLKNGLVIKGKKEGTHTDYFGDGRLYSSETYKSGKLIGPNTYCSNIGFGYHCNSEEE